MASISKKQRLDNVVLHTTRFIWEIENFGLTRAVIDREIISSVFQVKEWELEWIIKINQESIIIENISQGVNVINVDSKSSFSILNSTGTELFKHSDNKRVFICPDNINISTISPNKNFKSYMEADGRLIVCYDLDLKIVLRKPAYNLGEIKQIKTSTSQWSKTEVIPHAGISFKWTLNEDDIKRSQFNTVYSPTVATYINGQNTKWKLELEKQVDDLIIYISFYDFKVTFESFFFTFLCVLLNNEKKQVGQPHHEAQAFFHENCHKLICFSTKEFASESPTKESGHPYTVFCNINLPNQIRNTDKGQTLNVLKNNHSRFPGMDYLYENRTFSDVVFNVDGCELHAHKAILSARSSVFSQMFTVDMLEAKEGHVNIVDIDYHTMDNLLKYIYTGIAPNINQVAETLLNAAIKYDIKCLQKVCENVLITQVIPENAVKMLKLANLYNTNYLKICALDCIKKSLNAHCLETLHAEAPDTACEIFNIILGNKS